jgi:hypothetical protein
MEIITESATKFPCALRLRIKKDSFCEIDFQKSSNIGLLIVRKRRSTINVNYYFILLKDNNLRIPKITYAKWLQMNVYRCGIFSA